jgi:prevent-host-death family protein
MIANIRMLRSATKEILSTVARGECVIISNRGKPCAKITRVEPVSSLRSVSAAGLWKNNPRVASVKKFIDQQRDPLGFFRAMECELRVYP